MNLPTGVESTKLFGGRVSPTIEHMIEQARQAPREDVAAIL